MVLGSGQTLSGEIDDADLGGSAIDGDFYRVSLVADHGYTFIGDATVSADDSLDEIAIWIDSRSGPRTPTAEGAMPSVSFSPVVSGTYHLAVRAGGLADPGEKTGGYTVSMIDGGLLYTDTIPNNLSSTVTLGAGETLSGQIDQFELDRGDTDIDFYRMTLTAGHVYTFVGDATVSATDDLEQVAVWVDSSLGPRTPTAEGAMPSVTFAPVTSGTYHLAVVAGGPGDPADATGSYAVRSINHSLSEADGGSTLSGGAADDFLIGNIDGNSAMAGDGADLVWGLAGNDTLVGEAGDDSLFGNAGADALRGGAGDDWLKGHGDDDDLSGEVGRDTIFGGAGADTLRGDGDDAATPGADEINGNSGGDELYGGGGDDTVRGQGGSDVIHGDGGDDVLLGMSGFDTLNGGGGDDMLTGGVGDDSLIGGDGADVFQFATGHGADVIADFAVGEDKMSFVEASDLSELSITDGPGGAWVELVFEAAAPTLRVTLTGVVSADIGADDFIFG
ncbi:MAG: calcium-binding protein [Alphaproteobacteria bacterium]